MTADSICPEETDLWKRNVGEISLPHLSDAHKSRLSLRYGIDPDEPQVREMVQAGLLKSISSSQELREILGRDDIEGTGLYIGYPGSGLFTIRLDEPIGKDGREIKYLRPYNQRNGLFVPSGTNLNNSPEIWITEGELKALAGAIEGLPLVALSGIWCWRTETADKELLPSGVKLEDDEALIPELADISWTNKKVILLYDSDIVPSHPGYQAFQRLAEQLYRLGTLEVRIVTLPPLSDKKTGLDDFLIAKGDDALADLHKVIDRQEPYIPKASGAKAYADRFIKSKVSEDRLKATFAYLSNMGEYATSEWLKVNIEQSKSRDLLLKDAKAILKAETASGARSKVAYMPRGSQYISRDGCLFKVVKRVVNDEEKEILRPVCNFTAYPIKQVLKDNGLEVMRFLEVGGASSAGDRFPPALVSMETFTGMSWIASSWGAQASLEPGWGSKDELRCCIQSMVTNETPMEKIYTHLGWRKIGSEWCYLHAGSPQVEIHGRLQRYVLPEKVDDLQESLKASLSLLEIAPESVTMPLLALVYLTPLCEPLRMAGIEPGFLPWLYGITGSMKSTIAALFLSHYGQFDNKTLPCSFRDTPASLEGITFDCKDCLLIVDDFYPSSSFREREKMESTAQHLVRSYGDRTGRGRMRSDMTARASHPPRGMALATGEDLPHGQSTMARLFIIGLHPGDVDKKKLTEAQSKRLLLSQAMLGYIQWLAPRMDNLPDELLTEFKSLREKAQSGGRHSRLPEAVAHMYLGLSLFLDFAESQGAISEAECRDLAENAWDTLVQVVDKQSEIVKGQQPVEMFFTALQELIVQGKICLADEEDKVPPGLEHIPGIPKIGWEDDGKIYLATETAYTAVCQHYRSQGITFPVSKATLLDQMEDRGMILKQIIGEAEKRTIQKRFGDAKPWVVEIKTNLLVG